MLYTQKQVAEELQVCERTVARLRSSGKLGFHVVAGNIRISKEQLDDYLSAVRHEKSEQRARTVRRQPQGMSILEATRRGREIAQKLNRRK